MGLKARAEQLFGLGALWGWRQRYRVGAVVCALMAMLAPLGTTPAAAGEPPDYVVAEVPVPSNFWGGSSDTMAFTPSQIEGFLCDSDEQVNCSALAQPQLTFSLDQFSAGTTLWFDATNPGFAAFAGALTDGAQECIEAETAVSGGSGSTCELEPFFFGDQVGPNGVDLAGFAIDRVGIRVDTFSFTHPTPTSTDFQMSGALLVVGRIAVKEECKDGGWQNLHRGDGTGFRNQGDCIQFFNTGK